LKGKLKKAELDEAISSILKPEGSSRAQRNIWIRLIKRIYGLDPLTCPKCQGRMRIIAFIENQQVVKKILTHLLALQLSRKDSFKKNV